MTSFKKQIYEYAGINILPAHGHGTMGNLGDASFIGPDGKMKGGNKRSIYKVPKSSIHNKKNSKDLPPEMGDEEDTGEKSYTNDESVPKNSIHHEKFKIKELDGKNPMGTVGDASFIGKNGMYKGNSRKPVFKTPKSSIHYKKGKFENEPDFYNVDNWETDAPGPSTNVAGKRAYVGNKSVPKNSIHYDDIPSQRRKVEQMGIPMSADGVIDGGPRSRDPIAGKKTKKKKFADASKFGYPKEEKQMENMLNEDDKEILQQIASDLNRFNPGGYSMKGEVETGNNRVSIDFRDLGNWIDDVQDGQEDYEDNDQRIWAPGQYKKYLAVFDKWASSKPWYNKVKLDLSTSEKDWCYFEIYLEKNKNEIKKGWEANEVIRKHIEKEELLKTENKIGDVDFSISEGTWHALVNNFVAYREGQLHVVAAYRDENMLDARIERFKHKAVDILKRTNFDQEFTKVILEVKKGRETKKEEKDYDTNIVPKTSIHYGERDTVPGEPKMKFENTTSDVEKLDLEMLDLINQHREATGHEPFQTLTRQEMEKQMKLIDRNAQYGNDPWLNERNFLKPKSGFIPDDIKNLKTQGDWKSNLTKAVMDLTGEAEPEEQNMPVPKVAFGGTPEFPYANEKDGSMSYPVPGGGLAIKKNGEWTFGDTPELPSTAMQGEPQSSELQGQTCIGFGEPHDDSEIDIPCTKRPLIKKLMMFIKNEQKNLHEGVALQGLYEGRVVKLNAIYEGEHRMFQTFVKTNEGKIKKIHFGPDKTEDCGMMKKKKEIKEYDSYDRAQYEPKRNMKTYSFLDMIAFGEFCQKNSGNVADLLPMWEKEGFSR